ncbi:uncharacterized protein N7473_004717 [Penicillium subrubescens]|uniref:uncharacterized protein n=1 Tax=Penicillium subrubescens TaxID=1316194 RepID=UPI0025455B34|nr:uncharacterized protein N7473_004717 [Penicillium subrubescens]KAJ5900647.1 hypothetical protein N7473_004717 [Penicillium subrubescens]
MDRGEQSVSSRGHQRSNQQVVAGKHPYDSPCTQRTEDHSEHNDSYPVGPVFLPELQTTARDQERQVVERLPIIPTLPDPNLQQSFAETYFEYCHPWCPVLDRDSHGEDLMRSPLLVNALALVGSHVNNSDFIANLLSIIHSGGR